MKVYIYYRADQSASLELFLRHGNEFVWNGIRLSTLICGEQSIEQSNLSPHSTTQVNAVYLVYHLLSPSLRLLSSYKWSGRPSRSGQRE